MHKNNLFLSVIFLLPLAAWGDNITFADANVKAICLQNWDTDGDGELSEAEAAAVTDLGTVFQYGDISLFDELQYFTGLTSIGSYAFQNCRGLTSVTIPKSVTSIGSYAFSGCSGLTEVTIPNSVTSIGNSAFSYCSGLTSVTIPNSVTSIGLSAFYGCSGLTSFTVEEGNRVYDSRNNCNAIIETTTNTLIAGCNNTIIPNSVTSIGNDAFNGCSGLTSLTIPNSVTSIGVQAFDGCSSLTAVKVGMESPLSIDSNTFTNRANATLYVPAGSKEAYQAADYWKEFGTIVEYGNITFADANVKALCVANWDADGDGELSTNEAAAVTDLGKVFQNNSTITSFDELHYFAGLTIIEGDVFEGCMNLTSVTIPENVTSIGDYVFQDCSKMTTIKVEWATPISITSETFPNRAEIALYVPVGRKVAYLAADYWKDFKEIMVSSLTDKVYITISSSGAATYCSDIDLDFTNVEGLRAYIATDYLTSYDEPTSMSSPSGNIDPDYVDKIPYVKMVRVYKVPAGTGLYIEGEEGAHEVPYGASSSLYYNLLIGTTAPVKLPTNEDISYFVLSHKTTNDMGIYRYRGGTLSAHKAYMQFPTEEIKIKNITMFNIVCGETDNITFADANVKAICVLNWDINGDGELSEAEAAAVTDLGTVFQNNATITSFDELQYFTGLNSIGEGAFSYCTNLVSVILPNSLQSIKSFAFGSCTSLNSIVIPASVTEISEDFDAIAFHKCSGINNISVDEGNTVYDSRNNCNAIIKTSENKLIMGCKNTVIPEDIITIGMNAFDNRLDGVSSIYIPNSVKVLEHAAFACTDESLKTVFLPSSLESIGDWCFGLYRSVSVIAKMETPASLSSPAFWENSNSTLYVPKGCKSVYQNAWGWEGFKEIVEFPDADVNQDGKVNVVDVVDIARFVVGTPSDKFVEFLADLNSDDEVNVADAVALVNEIAGDQNFAKAYGAPRQDLGDDRLMLTENDDHSLSLAMESQRPYTAFQFDLYTNSEDDVMNLRLNTARKNGHQLLYNKVDEGHYRVVALSLANNGFNGNNGELLNIQLDGFNFADMTIGNIHFITTDGTDHRFEDLTLSSATGIESLTPAPSPKGEGNVYDLSGRKVSESSVLPKGVYIVNGRKVIVK